MPATDCSQGRSLGWWGLLGLAACLLLAPTAKALDPQRPISQALLRVWQSQQGLPRGVIFALRQSSDGYLWLGTQAGLYRFDGVRFVPWTSPEFPIPEQLWVEDLGEDDAGHLWVATDGAGALRIRRESVEHFGMQDGLPSDRVHCVAVDHEGIVWLGTQAGLSRFRDGQLEPDSIGLNGRNITALAESSDGRMWIVVDGRQLHCWNGSTQDAVELPLPSPRTTVQSLCATLDGTLWVGTTDGLMARRATGVRLLTTTEGLAHNLVHTLAADGVSGLWVGTKEGLCRIQGDRIERFQAHDGLSQSTVHALCEDSDGDLWVGTKHGLNQFVDRRSIFPFTTAEGLPSNSTGPLFQETNGTIWVGTLGAGLARLNGRRFESVATTENGLPSNRILSLAQDPQQGLWIGTNVGLCRWVDSKTDGIWATGNGLPAAAVTCLRFDARGRLWVGTAGGLVAFRDGQLHALDGPELDQPVHALVEGPEESLIASIGEKLYQVQNNRLSPLPDGLQFSAVVSALHRDADQRLWLTLPGKGLGLIEGEQRHEFGIRDGLFDDDLYGITSNDKGQLWIGCSRGIFALNKDELLQFVRGDVRKLTSLPFSPTDALRTIECREGVQPSIWKMQDGKVWFSTARGIIVVAPERVGAPLPPPKVLIEDVRVNGRETRRGQLHGLPPGQNNLEIRFTALSLAWPARISFRYRLQGFDHDWVDSGFRREAFYTNLPPGTYSFQVQATSVDGTTATVAEPLEITLRPFFHQTRWFLPSVGLILAGFGWLAYHVRMRQIKSRWQAVIAERNRIARELHDTLIQGFSGVTMQLQALSVRLRPSAEFEKLTGIIRDAAGCLSEARRSVAGLRQPQPGPSNLATALAETVRQFTDGGDVHLELKLQPLARPLHPEIEYQMVRIVQEAVANAVKHASADEIVVALEPSGHSVRITVTDDGAGFDPSAYLNQPPPGHYGMIGIRERAAQIKATVTWRSEAHRGTTVTLTRPLEA